MAWFPILFQFRDDEPSWCERNHCSCPCHKGTEGGPGCMVVPLILLCAGLLIWAVCTLLSWADPGILEPKRTLVQVLLDQWRWLMDLLHRIW